MKDVRLLVKLFFIMAWANIKQGFKDAWEPCPRRQLGYKCKGVDCEPHR